MNERPFVRVVVVNYRSAMLTHRCLESLARLTYPTDRREVVVVDNASGDDMASVVSTHHPDVRFVQNDTNRGFGAGCNAGIALDGEWDAIALVNNDSVVEPGWLDAMVHSLTTSPLDRTGAVAGKVLLAGTTPPLVNSAGCELRDGGFNADRGDGEADDERFTDAVEVFGWSGASALLSREMLDDVGVFDESLFLYYEDVDLVWRGRRRGWSVLYCPDAVSTHERGASAGRGQSFWFHDTRNRLVVLARHAPIGWLVRAIAVQVSLAVRATPDTPGPSRSTRWRALGSLAARSPRLVRERRRLDRAATVPRAAVTAWLR